MNVKMNERRSCCKQCCIVKLEFYHDILSMLRLLLALRRLISSTCSLDKPLQMLPVNAVYNVLKML